MPYKNQATGLDVTQSESILTKSFLKIWIYFPMYDTIYESPSQPTTIEHQYELF